MSITTLGLIIQILVLIVALVKALGWFKDQRWWKTVEAGVAFAEQWKILLTKRDGVPPSNEKVKDQAISYVLERIPLANPAKLSADIESAVYSVTKACNESTLPKPPPVRGADGKFKSRLVTHGGN